MTISSMTGFARASGHFGRYSWSWEVRSVNGRGLDIRSRLPSGFEHLDPLIRSRLQDAFARGNFQVSLTLKRESGDPEVRLNKGVLEKIVIALNEISGSVEMAPPRADGLLALRGVLDIIEPEDSEAESEERDKALIKSFDEAVEALAARRRAEGDALMTVLKKSLADIKTLAERAGSQASAQPTAIRERLSAQIAELLAPGNGVSPERLSQEVALLVARADIREEIDRLQAHVQAALEVLEDASPSGRKLDFLMQEFNREANTLCSKSSDINLTRIGLDLKAVIGQVREQVQNIE